MAAMPTLKAALVGAFGAVAVCLFVAFVLPQSTPEDRMARGVGQGKQCSELNGKNLKSLADLSDVHRFREQLLPKIAKVRVPDTPGNKEVREFIVSELRKLDKWLWTVEIDRFEDTTPKGVKKFANIIATLNSEATERLVLAAHYDSKLMDKDKSGRDFIGATDSAVPCAMLLDVAVSLNGLFHRKGEELAKGLQLIFFDGEEAFVKWTKEDSIYGSKHLAEVMAKRNHSVAVNKTELEVIDAFILLDLIGAKGVQFHHQFQETSGLFKRFQKIEKKSYKKGLLKNYSREKPYFYGSPDGKPVRLGIEDDHIPFLNKGVPVLHLISVPFPRVWHTTADDMSALDFDTIDNLNLILRTFVADYFNLLCLL